MANEVDAPTGVDAGYTFLENFGAVDGAACCGDSCDEDFVAIFLQNFLYTAPVGHFHGCDGGSNLYAVEAEEAMAEHDWVAR